jgi:hypothetical protein
MERRSSFAKRQREACDGPFGRVRCGETGRLMLAVTSVVVRLRHIFAFPPPPPSPAPARAEGEREQEPSVSPKRLPLDGASLFRHTDDNGCRDFWSVGVDLSLAGGAGGRMAEINAAADEALKEIGS